jgi:GTP diphosphokinase / guanosine-3',5'-bis(diphosphate) 3'-diphosphatase
MVNGVTIDPSGKMTFEDLLGYWDQGGSKYLLRKAFGLMLNLATAGHETGHAEMVLETVQIVLQDLKLGFESVLCCILKNVADQGVLSPEVLELEFGKPVMTLIEGIHKLEQLDTTKYNSNKENFIGLLVTLSDDIRVLLIRLAMRLYDMRHLEEYPLEKQRIIAGETMALYSPIAERLGLYRIREEMEDRIMQFNEPVVYKQIERKLLETKTDRNTLAENFIKPIAMRLEENGFDCEIKNRIKSIPSISHKMKKQNVGFEEVYDLFAVRIILNNTVENEVADCWKIYSLVTDIYAPDPHRLRDWVSFPKSNGYESIHTTVKGPDGQWVEIQIRTRSMDEVAEKGYAAHWKYKSEGEEVTEADLFRGLRELLEPSERVSRENSIARGKNSTTTDDIFVFTPKGDLKKLRQGYSVLDFAGEFLPQNGSVYMGAIVNGKIVPLTHPLKNGDTVKLLTSRRHLL